MYQNNISSKYACKTCKGLGWIDRLLDDHSCELCSGSGLDLRTSPLDLLELKVNSNMFGQMQKVSANLYKMYQQKRAFRKILRKPLRYIGLSEKQLNHCGYIGSYTIELFLQDIKNTNSFFDERNAPIIMALTEKGLYVDVNKYPCYATTQELKNSA